MSFQKMKVFTIFIISIFGLYDHHKEKYLEKIISELEGTCDIGSHRFSLTLCNLMLGKIISCHDKDDFLDLSKPETMIQRRYKYFIPKPSTVGITGSFGGRYPFLG